METAEIRPEVVSTIATDGLLLLHTPPAVELANAVVPPMQAVSLPTIVLGMPIIVSVATDMPQLCGSVYVMYVVPASSPVTIPVEALIEAKAGNALVHVPPVTTLDKVVVPPMHSRRLPRIGPGCGATVTVYETMHPTADVYVIVTVPAPVPVTRPVVGVSALTVALAALAEYQAPLGDASESVIVPPPAHTLVGPVMAGGGAYTVITIVAGTGHAVLYEIVVVPAASPVTTPAVEIPALAVAELLHVPPGEVLLSEAVAPMHTDAGPVTGPGGVVTVTVLAAVHPVPILYVIVAVPEPIPVTTPEELTLATLEELLVHVPPPIALARLAVAPTQSMVAAVGVMAGGAVTTVTTPVAEHPPMVYEMVAVPAVLPAVTTPDDDTEAMPVAPPLHAPPDGVPVSVLVAPEHSVPAPVTAPVGAVTVTICVPEVKGEAQSALPHVT